MLPLPSPMFVNPEGAIRDFTEHVLSGDRRNMCTERDAAIIGDWCKNENYKKIIMEVIEARIDLAWPYNYKVLDLLGACPLGMVVEMTGKVKGLAESASGVEGAADLKKIGKALLDKAEKEKGKMDEEEAKKRQEAIKAMWGGLWANDGFRYPAGLAQPGWTGWQHPYQYVGAPGVPAQAAAVEWRSKAPEGWAPYVCYPSYHHPHHPLWPTPLLSRSDRRMAKDHLRRMKGIVGVERADGRRYWC